MTPMDFTGVGARVRKLVGQKRPQELSRSALTPDALRDNVIDEEIRESDRMRNVLDQTPAIEFETENEDGTREQHRHLWVNFDEAVKDVARASYQFEEPTVRPAHEVMPSHQLERELLSEIVASEELRNQRMYTRGHAFESLFSGMAAAEDLVESAKTRLPEHIKRSQDMAAQEQEMRDAEEMLDKLREQARDEHCDLDEGVTEETANAVKEQIAKREQARGELRDLLQQQAQSGMAKAARAAAASAAEAANKAAHAIASLPGIGAGDVQHLSTDQQLALAERILRDPILRKIMQNLGSLVRDMKFKRKNRTRDSKIEPVGVTTGRDFRHMLPQELARACHPNAAVRATFVNDWSQYACLQFELTGKEPAGQGPVVNVEDQSLSMRGDKHVYASTVSLAQLQICRDEKRDFAHVAFSSGGQVKAWIFPKDEPVDVERIIDMVGHFFGGGTETHLGIGEALRIIEEAPEFSTADVVIVGDGEDQVREQDVEIKQRFDELDVRVHGIAIQCPRHSYLDQICESVVDVSDLTVPDEATDHLARNVS